MNMYLTDRLCVLFFLVNLCYCDDFTIPELMFKAYEPYGFKASIQAQPGIQMLAFHGKVNEEINQIEPGAFGEDVKVPNKDGYFTYYNPTLELKVGDEINYWVFVQYKQFGYRKDAQKWKVTKLLKETCGEDGANLCAGTVILSDEFDANTIETSNWIIEQYVPYKPEVTSDYEFVVYKNDPEVVFTRTGMLVIKPKLLEDTPSTKNDLLSFIKTHGCIKAKESSKRNCDVGAVPHRYISTIVSGRVVTNKTISNGGEIEVKAKLPGGDWIYPEIYLEDEFSEKKIYIAYSRGNPKLLGNNPSDDIGGKLLFAGPSLRNNEPKRSEKLSSVTSPNGQPFSDDFHVYKLKWNSGKIQVLLDGNNFGEVSANDFRNAKVRLVLGLGVGGINDFPDGFKSDGHEKPWIDRTSSQMKDFLNKKDLWLPTWVDGGQMLIDYVKIISV